MIKNIIKGFIIGTGKIMPGVSGSMLAISLNIYEKLLNIIANIKKTNYPSLKFLISITIGILISIITFSKIIKWSLNAFYIPIMFFFTGLILGGTQDIIKKIEIHKSNNNIIKHFIIFMASFTLSLKLTQISSINFNSTNNISNFFLLGLIEAFTSIIPGISGTAIYMSLGVYDTILNLFSNLLNPKYIIKTLIFGLGILTGIYTSAKIITYLLKKYKNYTFITILGFMSSAIIIMIKQTIVYILRLQTNIIVTINIAIGLILLLVGTKITKTINSLSNNN